MMKKNCSVQAWRGVVCIAGIFVVCVYGAAMGETLEQDFLEASHAYKENNYDQAIATYEAILMKGYESGNLYYNLANSYFKKGELAKALLHYKRAELFIPGDSDLKANYSYCRSSLQLGQEETQENWFLRLIDAAFAGFNLNCLAIALSLGQVLLFFLGILYQSVYSLRRFCKAGIIISMVILFLGALSFKRKIEYQKRTAVVMVKELVSRFEPLESATTHFILAEGATVEVLESSGAWHKIRRRDTKTGWVNKEGIAFIAAR